jgi:hypothetical protein
MGTKGSKVKGKRAIKVRDLAPKKGKQPKGGGKAGGDKTKYMEVKMKEVIVTGV